MAISSAFPTGTLAAPVCKDAGHPINVSATNLAFGIYTSGSPLPLDSNSTVQVYCSNLTNILPSFTVSLSAGGAGSFNPRKLSNGSIHLNYNMYTNATYTIIWGDGTSGTSTQSYTQSQNLGQISFTDFGQVPAHQIVAAGAYTDTITVTVTF
ncbi:MAG TPA: spore coat U domain-containing protein [Rhizomicrobium sp.]